MKKRAKQIKRYCQRKRQYCVRFMETRRLFRPGSVCIVVQSDFRKKHPSTDKSVCGRQIITRRVCPNAERDLTDRVSHDP